MLRELGERLVGRAHIALAELIKNSYDADATVVDVVIDESTIVVRDNGHGMTYDEFSQFWMRIGSPHKERQQASRQLKRPLTGSKGVGRLAAQFLAHRMELRSVSDTAVGSETVAEIDWDDAVSRGLLQDAEALVKTQPRETAFAAGSMSGTSVRMRRLKQDWGPPELQDLARQLWPLQPPFYGPENEEEDEGAEGVEQSHGAPGADELLAELNDLPRAATDDPRSFTIRLRTHDPSSARAFERQMRRVLDLWAARVVGNLVVTRGMGRRSGELVVDVEFSDGSVVSESFVFDKQPIHGLEFEIRIFDLHNRQRFQIPVGEAREYLRLNGGVHVYDAGFHLPYYGADTDWLNIERDHANRLSLSDLLPSEMNVHRGLQALPTNRRVYGVVTVNTAKERRLTPRTRRQRDALTIQVSRDRLVDNAAYRALAKMVRQSVDFYAVTETARRTRTILSEPDDDPAPLKARRVRDVLEEHRGDIAPVAFTAVTREVDAVLVAVESEAEKQAAQAGLLATLATAGVAALASEHEFSRHLERISSVTRRLDRATSIDEIPALVTELKLAVADSRAAREIFGHLLDPDDQLRRRLLARPLLENTARQLRNFMRGVAVDVSGVSPQFRLPAASAAEWTSLFQNVFVNAANAMLDVDERRIDIAAGGRGNRRWLSVQDTGAGVDTDNADILFEPFRRLQTISDDRKGLGFGGTGLGLTIVRMLAQRAGCTVAFEVPDEEHNTALTLRWEER